MPHTQSVRVRLVATLHTLSVRGCYNLYGMLKKRNRTGNETGSERTYSLVLPENGTSTEKREMASERASSK